MALQPLQLPVGDERGYRQILCMHGKDCWLKLLQKGRDCHLRKVMIRLMRPRYNRAIGITPWAMGPCNRVVSCKSGLVVQCGQCAVLQVTDRMTTNRGAS